MYWIWKISRNNLYEISRNFAKCIGVWKIYIAKQFREIIYTKFREISYKFREMYWYLKNLHNETISRNKLYEISRNFAKCIGIWKIYITKQFREIIFTKIREIKITFVVISYLAK
jgi:hypothetical protein